MQGGDDAGGALLADVGKFHVAVEGDAAMIAQVVEEHLLTLTVADGLGGVCFLGSGLVAHDALVQAAGEDVLVGDAVIDVPVAVVIDRLLGCLGDVGLDYCLAVDVEHLEGHVLLGTAIHLCRRLNHVNLLLAAHSGTVAVVLDTDEQVPAAIVGKCADGACYLAGIGDLILEILMLMLTLLNKALNIAFSLNFHYKCKDNDFPTQITMN